MRTEEKTIIKTAKKTLKYYIEFLERVMTDLNTYDEDKVGRAVLAISCIHSYFDNKFKEDMDKMMEEFIKSRSH